MPLYRKVGAGGAALLDDASIAALHQTLAGAGGLYAPARVLFSLVGANMNSTADQQFTKLGTFTNWNAFTIIAANASLNLTTAAGGIYSAASKGGDALIAASQVYTSLTTASGRQPLTFDNTKCGVRNETPYLSLTTGQGATATADFYIYGVPLS